MSSTRQRPPPHRLFLGLSLADLASTTNMMPRTARARSAESVLQHGGFALRPYIIVAAACFGVLASAPAEAGVRICKDGYVTYAGSGAYPSRYQAEVSALRAWRKAGEKVGLFRKRSFPPSDHIRCTQSEDGKLWRCFVRTGRCKSA